MVIAREAWTLKSSPKRYVKQFGSTHGKDFIVKNMPDGGYAVLRLELSDEEAADRASMKAERLV
jgi:hypothetical protein